MSVVAAPTDELFAALRMKDEVYDPAWRAVSSTRNGNEYHTRLRRGTLVHPTVVSAEYALGLLDAGWSYGGEGWRIDRAVELLRRLVEAQDTDPGSDTHGIWSWFYDEPLDQMATPDWNWADFIGVRLVQVLLRHGDALATRDGKLHDAVGAALAHAGRSIMRRDVKLSYTNIAVMGCYVTVMAGDLLEDDEISSYGRDRLRRLVAFTEEYGGFSEYNSPAYTCTAIVELTRMLRDYQRDEDRQLARGLHDRAWQEVATHWHVPSGQWAGPHSRSYATMLGGSGRSDLDVVQRGLAGRAVVSQNPVAPSLNHWRVPLHCPDEFIEHFTNPAPSHDVVAEVSNATAQVTALTRLRPEYTLGVASYGTFWAQARPVVAYAPGADGPVAFRLRLLYDQKDFAAGRIFTTVTDDGTVLAGICVADDTGASHPNLDHEWTGRVRASEIRLRAEFLGVPRGLLPAHAQLGETVEVRLGTGAVLDLRALDAALGDYQPWLDIGGSGSDSHIDVVLYAGGQRTFELTPDLPFYTTLALRLTTRTGAEAADVADKSNDVEAVVTHRSAAGITVGIATGCQLHLPTTPTSAAELEALATHLQFETEEVNP